MIDPEQAWRMVSERGLLLPTHKEYTHPRVKEIAVLLEYLFTQTVILEQELGQIRDAFVKESGQIIDKYVKENGESLESD